MRNTPTPGGGHPTPADDTGANTSAFPGGARPSNGPQQPTPGNGGAGATTPQPAPASQEAYPVVPGAVKGASPDAPTQAQAVVRGQPAGVQNTGGNGVTSANGQGAGAQAAPQASQGQQQAQTEQQTGQQAGQQVQVEVPEKPKLADDINLKGEMQESAFEEPPWLLERDGGYIQVPKLLYHVAEQCTGDQTHEQMAEAVGQKLGRKVTADNIKTLVAKLIPMGIVDVPGLPKEARKRGSAAGALSVNAKMLRIPPHVFSPLSRVLQVFYLKPVLLLTLLVTFAAEAWMFFVHGLGGGIHDALYTPGLLIAVFALVIVATAFHEFGHASALQKGGGQVGEMGAGIYIVYPAFYTDVTDNYRLSRWARVRTDLGGIYFSLIFSAALMALYVATDSAFLLMVVLFINFEIFHNMLPFVRLDGYWTLADITGIPDFFSMLAPYCRTHKPFKWLPLPDGRKCPNLKPWARWVFALYIIITVPLLAFLLVMMVMGVPRLLATFWDAAWQQVGNIGKAWDGGDFLGVVAAGGQLLLLALPTFALLFTLFNLGKRLVTGVWSWGKKSPRNGVIAGLGSVAAVLLLLFLWSPSLLLSLFVRGVPERGPLQELVQFRPIGQQERFTVGDVLTGQVVTTTRKSGLALFGLDFGSPPTPVTATTTPTITATTTITAGNVLTVTATPRSGSSATAPAGTGTPRTSTPTVAVTTTATLTATLGTLTPTVTPTLISGSPVASVAPSTTGTVALPTSQGTVQPTATRALSGTGTATAAPLGGTTTPATGSTAQPTGTSGAGLPTTTPAASTPTTPPAGATASASGSTPTAGSGTGSTPVAPAPTSATVPTATPAVAPPAPTSTPVPAGTTVVQPTSAPIDDTPVAAPTSTPIPTSTPTPTPTPTPTFTPTPTPTSTPVPVEPTAVPEVAATATPSPSAAQDTPVTDTPPTATSVPVTDPVAPTATTIP
ncbi:MAG TPA: hypothetical protein VEY08_05030 [Chloroflexia bacterium]|nr:hypothetical protein [Chloroflexia bacterium]